ncbi:hypothetical protein DSL72_003145 [Monilinia vaccinii-corymbosi]|uniref:BTB domain-containing protein n=1 Tax=Monilinia vaccinii-corymbosi TaxID=61207 RepID=A0A8A3P0E2_9HELO|nr:hypothetical protein DSL72_003145 [Monilinia vaccinii-corymbosi]
MALFEVTADAFYGKIGLFKGDGVLVSLAPSGSETSKTTRLLPQALLFSYSKVCEGKIEFSASGSDSVDEVIHTSEKDSNAQCTRKPGVIDLNEWDAETFDMALQWMYTGTVVLKSEPSNPFKEVRSCVQFFKIANALQLSGSFKLVEQKLRAALIAAQVKHNDENQDVFTCNPVFKEALRVAFTNPMSGFVRELLASFFVESYANCLLCPDKITARTFGDLFETIEGLEIEVLRLVGSSLKSIFLGKARGGRSRVFLLCPLTETEFGTVKEFKIGHKPVAPKFGNR